MKGHEIDGRVVNIDVAADKPAVREDSDRSSPRNQISAPSATLFVSNLAFSTGEDTLSEVFSECSGFKGARVITDRDSGSSKGFGYVDFTDIQGAQDALAACNGQDIDGRAIRIDYATERTQSSDGGRGGGRGGSRGGYGGGRGGGRGDFRGGFGGGRGGGRGDFRGGRGGSRGGFGGAPSRASSGIQNFAGTRKAFD